MRKNPKLLILAVAFSLLAVSVRAQDTNTKVASSIAGKTVVVANQAKTDSEIAVPPATSVTISLSKAKKTPPSGAIDLPAWLSKQTELNGLQPAGLLPWHIVIEYDRFDEDGDNVDSGVFEEYWAGPKKYKRSYKSDGFNQTDVATENGLYRSGDQKWPSAAQSKVRAEIILPFWDASPQGFHGVRVERQFGGYKFQCVAIEGDSDISDPQQYCFESVDGVLRYSRGGGWDQTAYNRIIQFQGRDVAQDVTVTDGGKPYLKLLVKTLEGLSQSDDAMFTPANDAIGPLGTDRVSGVHPVPLNLSSMPDWPTNLRGQHFVVQADVVIGKNGHVVSAHATAGPPAAYKACEDAVRKWIFKPYLVLDKPVEVIQKVQCQSN